MHGGDIYRNKIEYDFSVNINPCGIPQMVKTAMFKSLEDMTAYPDLECERLREGLAKRYEVKKDNVVCGNGASELILGIFHTYRPKKVLLIAPGFLGYENAAKVSGTEIIYFYLDEKENYEFNIDSYMEALDIIRPDMIFITNPNNPNGNVIKKESLRNIALYCETNAILMVLDECFIELSLSDEVESFAKESRAFDNVIMLNAFTKSFAMPGVRLGFLICNDIDKCNAIKRELPEWNVSIIANNAGIAALKEESFLTESRKLISKEREFLSKQLSCLGFKVYPSRANYIMFKAKAGLKEKLIKKGILIRDCSDYEGLQKGFYRVAVKTRQENVRLIAALKNEELPVDIYTSNIEYVLPNEIENRSFEIIGEELKLRGIVLPQKEELVIKRAIHTSADFEYANTLCFSKDVVEKARELIKKGAVIVTDTNMAKAGINKTTLAKFGGEVFCFMADEDVAKEAKQRAVTRATVSMEKASKIDRPVIFAIGNAPTALIALKELMDNTGFRPALIIGVPVGFVNVEAAKELIIESDVPFIVNRGRKGGSNIAAAICNALMYGIDGAR